MIACQNAHLAVLLPRPGASDYPRHCRARGRPDRRAARCGYPRWPRCDHLPRWRRSSPRTDRVVRGYRRSHNSACPAFTAGRRGGCWGRKKSRNRLNIRWLQIRLGLAGRLRAGPPHQPRLPRDRSFSPSPARPQPSARILRRRVPIMRSGERSIAALTHYLAEAYLRSYEDNRSGGVVHHKKRRSGTQAGQTTYNRTGSCHVRNPSRPLRRIA